MPASAQRWLAPEGCEVHSNAIDFEIDTRIFEHAQALLDESSMGVDTGLAVTVNGVDSTRIDVALGAGYAPNGAFVEFPVGQSSVQLASSVLGTVNLVILFYTEVQGTPVPHETNATSPNSRSSRSSRLRVYTLAQYNALAATDDNNLNTDARDRGLVVARVTATGGGLTSGNIQLPRTFSTINYATTPINITGVTITAVSSGTQEGNGTLTFTSAGTFLKWQAPNETAGGNVAVGAGGSFTLTSGGGSTLQVSVITASLPVADKTDTITITNLYSQVVPRFSAVDAYHRSLLGTGTPTPTNPHGIRVEDIGGIGLAELETHQDVEHSNGIWRGSASNVLLCSIDETTAPDRILVVAPAGVDTYYVNGRRLSTLASSAVTFSSAPANAVLFEVLVDNTGILSTSQRLVWPSPRLVTGVEIIDLSDSTAAGSRTLSFTFAGSLLSWGGGPAAGVSAGGRFRLISSDEASIVDVHVVAASLPGSNQSDVMTINARASDDTFMRIGVVNWTGSATGFLGYTPSRGVTAAQMLDKRTFGTLSEVERADELVRNRTRPIGPSESGADNVIQVTQTLSAFDIRMNELRQTGVSTGNPNFGQGVGLGVTAGAGLTVAVDGGIAYVFGKRYEVAQVASLTVPDNATSHVYVDAGGNVRVVNTSIMSFVNLVGGSSGLANQGSGAVLARVVTSGGSVTQVIDFRRNLTRSDDKATFSVGHGTIAQFASLVAALEYADNYGISKIRIVGSITETINASISTPVAFPKEIACDVDVGVTFTGTATFVFSLSGTDSGLIWTGGFINLPAGMGFITYAGGSNSHVLVEGVNLTMAGSGGNLFKNTTDAVGNRGVKFKRCFLDGGTGSAMVNFTTGWDGVLGFYDCKIDITSNTFIADTLGGADTINTVEVYGCEVIATTGATGSGNSTHNDWKIIDSRFTLTGAFYDMDGTANRLFIRGCYIDANSGIILDPASAKTYADVMVADCTFAGNFTGAKFACGSSGRLVRTTIDSCILQAPSSGTPSAISIQPTGGSTVSVIISNNVLTTGRIIFGGAGTKENISIIGNVFNGQVNQSGSAAIFIQTATTQYTITGNTVTNGGGSAGDVCGIRADTDHGSISSNIIEMVDVTAANDGIRAGGAFLTIVGNEIEIDGTGASRLGISTSGSDLTISENSITVDDAGIGSNGIRNSGPRCAVVGNRIEMTASAADGDAIELDSSADDSTISGNVVSFTNAGASADGAGIRCSADRTTITGNSIFAPDAANVTCIAGTGHSIACTGNRCSATAATPDVSLTGDRNTFVGNVITNAAGSSAGTATVSGTASVNANNIP